MAVDDDGFSVEESKKRCRRFIDSIQRLPPSIPDSCTRTLLRLARAELAFLIRRPYPPFSHSSSAPLSVNVGHLEAVLHILQQPFVTGVSQVCKPVPRDRTNGSVSKTTQVDIVCSAKGSPVWIIASDRNPKNISWDGCDRHKGLRARIEQVLAAGQSSLVLRPSSVVLFFSKGVDGRILEEIKQEYGAAEFEMGIRDFHFSEEEDGEWVNIVTRSYQESVALEIKVDHLDHAGPASESGLRGLVLDSEATNVSEEKSSLDPHGAFSTLISVLKLSAEASEIAISKSSDLLSENSVINFDTTALIALVSEISNGSAERILSKSEDELRQRFKGNTDFVIAQVRFAGVFHAFVRDYCKPYVHFYVTYQVNSELQKPILVEIVSAISSKRGIICETVLSEFKELISMCGGPREKLRASQLLKRLSVVPDHPSDRIANLPTTRKLDGKNKIVFGTGDYWQAPTLTANMAFVRAVLQTGMSLYTINHRPRALTGD